MKIESVTYALDIEGNPVALIVVDDEGSTRNAPIGGVTWINQAVDEWVADGNTIAPGTIPVPD